MALITVMLDTFIKLLEKQHDLGKKSDTGFKPEAWVICCEAIQEKYTVTEYIKIEKLKSKLNFV